MLDTLKIKNIALIDYLEIEFGKGLNIITGETGAGKSIIVNSLQLILGKRGSLDIIRTNEDKCEVEAIFDIKGTDDFLIVKRVLTKSNKNKIKINDEFSTLSKLKSITEDLIDFSAQNQYLFKNENQLYIYDLFCGLYELKEKFKKNFIRYNELKKEILEKEYNKVKILEKLEFLKYQLNELEQLNLNDIDENELKNQIEYFGNIELIKSSLEFIFEKINEKNSLIGEIKQKISEIQSLKPSFKEILNILENIEVEIGEITNICLQEIKEIPDDSFNINDLLELEDKINNLKKKHGKKSVKELIELREKFKKEIEKLENFEISLEKEKLELNNIEQTLFEISEKLSFIRKKNKKKFEREIENILKNLNMEKVKFVVKIDDMKDFSSSGRNKIEFLISTNEGEIPKLIKNIASGGEKSRIMLALKSFLSDYLDIPILIFDEIDAGTGGETAFAIGKLLKKLSKTHQVFTITHFPQVAAFADNHYKVYKVFENGKTFTRIKKLNYNERIEELARMISGNISEKVKLSAEELINEAKKSYC